MLFVSLYAEGILQEVPKHLHYYLKEFLHNIIVHIVRTSAHGDWFDRECLQAIDQKNST